MDNSTAMGVRILRECLGTKTLTKFASQLGVARSTLSMIFLGKSRPGRKVMSHLAELHPERRAEITAFLLRLNGQDTDRAAMPMTTKEPAP